MNSVSLPQDVGVLLSQMVQLNLQLNSFQEIGGVKVIEIGGKENQKDSLYTVENISRMSNDLYSLKLKVHSLCLEQLFMQRLNPTIKLKTSLEMQKYLKEIGFNFRYTGREHFIIPPFLSNDIPFSILKLLCRVEKMALEISQPHDYSIVDKIRYCVQESISLKERYRDHEKIITTFFLHIGYMQLRLEFQKSWNEVKTMFAGMRHYLLDYPSASFSLSTKTLLQADELDRNKLKMVSEYRGKLDVDCSSGALDLERSDMDAEAQLQHCQHILEALNTYQEEMPVHQKEYEIALQRMKELSLKELGSASYVKLCTEKERPIWATLFINSQKFGQFVVERDVSTCVDEILAQKTCKEIRQKKKAVVVRGERKPKKKGSPQTHDKKVSEKPLEVLKKPSENEVVPEKAITEAPKNLENSSLEQSCASCCSTDACESKVVETPKVATLKKKKVKKAKVFCTQAEKASFDRIFLNAGPNLSFEYTWHVRRWEKNSGFDPITQDPEYMNQSMSVIEAQKIRFRHSFGRALDPILLNRAKPFIKKGPTGVVVRRNYCLLGDMHFTPTDFIRGIFRIAVGVDNKIIHRFFTKMSSVDLLEKYKREGSFAIDSEEKEMVPQFSATSCSNAKLPDDGSRVVHVSRESIQVKCLDGEVLTVDPFSDI